MAEDPLRICLVAEDSDEDFESLQRAFRRNPAGIPLRRVVDGDELLDYLNSRGDYTDVALPLLVLLDLNLPGTDGREALEIIGADPSLRALPLIVFTTSASEEDVSLAYRNGANSFVGKPMLAQDFDRIVDAVTGFWFDSAELPGTSSGVRYTGG